MSSMNHPASEQLNAYVQDPIGDDYRQLRQHLAACVDCRQQVDLLSNLKTNLHEIEADQYQRAISQNDELHEILQAQLIEKYVAGQLNKDEEQRVTVMIKDNPQAMKAAMHYASHSARMQRELGDDAGSLVISKSNHHTAFHKPIKSGVLTMLRHWLEVRSPVWLTVPATAAIASLLSILLIPQLNSHLNTGAEKISVVAYQDNPVIQFKRTQNLPGIGFFSGANKTTKPYDRITANVFDNNTIQLSWPRVDNAVSYTMQLKIFANGQQLSVDKLTTTATQASFKRAANDSGHRYIWRLTGKTGAGELFSTKGGFIINSGNN